MKRCLYIAILLSPQAAHAQTGNQMANPVVMVIVLGALALAPFIIVMLTSFVKISVVLSILRNALGTQQVPPNQIITGTGVRADDFHHGSGGSTNVCGSRQRIQYAGHILRG